jgi:hypothetical protein
MASIIASDSNDLIISTTNWVVSSGIKKYFQSVCKIKIAAGLAGLFKQKMFPRVRRKRLNTTPGTNSSIICTCCIFSLNFTHRNLQLPVLSSPLWD